MRHDMFKVIVERPRVGGHDKRKGRWKENIRSSVETAKELYYSPKREWVEELFLHLPGAQQEVEVFNQDFIEPMGLRDREVPSYREKIRPVGRGTDRKEFNENLEPLWRYLQTQVGRCWDDVYSEIRENLSPRNTVQMHVVQHLKWKVRENTYLGKDGRVYEHAEYAGRGAAPRCLEEPSRYKHEFYVHPVTREFCATPTKTNRQPDHGPVKFQVDLLVQYRLINGGWYVVDFEKIPKGLGVKNKYYTSGKLYQADLFNDPTDYRTVGDFLFPSGLENHQREQEYGYANIRAVSWRPLGKREIKKLQTLLKNS